MWHKVTLVLFLCFVLCYSREMTSELREVLNEITPNFEENLKRAFINEGIREQHRHANKSHSLDDVLVVIDNTVIELRNLKLAKTPDFRINTFDVDLGMFTLNLGLSLGPLKVEGEYEVTNKALQKLLPISSVGKIGITLDNMSCDGKAGIIIKEDSFVVENYDLKYRPSEVAVRVSYFKEDGIALDNEIVEAEVEKTIAKTFWIPLTDILTNILHRQLGAVIVEYSVEELLLDEPTELRELSRQQSLRANRLLDSLLCTAKTYLVEQNNRILAAPPLSVVFRSRPPGTQQGSLETANGQLQDLSTLTRITQMSLFEDKDVLFVYGEIMLREFKFNYENYKGEYVNTVRSGSIRSTIYRNKIFVKISVHKHRNKCSADLDQVQFTTVSDIDMDVSGLGSLSWLNDRLRSWVIGNLRNQAIPILERKISEALNYAIRHTDCSIILAD